MTAVSGYTILGWPGDTQLQPMVKVFAVYDDGERLSLMAHVRQPLVAAEKIKKHLEQGAFIAGSLTMTQLNKTVTPTEDFVESPSIRDYLKTVITKLADGTGPSAKRGPFTVDGGTISAEVTLR